MLVWYINASVPGPRTVKAERYLRSLRKEIASAPQGDPKALFFAGVEQQAIEWVVDILVILEQQERCSECPEITLELTGPITESALIACRSAGANRISVVPTSDEPVDRLVQHLMLVSEIFAAVNVDIPITGKAWSNDLFSKVKGCVQHISLNFLEVNVAAESIAEQYDRIVGELEAGGYERYSSYMWAQPGARSVQQLAYQEREPFRGFGVGSCSFDGKIRSCTEASYRVYCKAIEKGESPPSNVELLSEEQQLLEEVMLGIASAKGVSLALLCKAQAHHGCGTMLCSKRLRTIRMLETAGLVILAADHIRLTAKGCAVEHEVVAKLLC